MSFQAYDETKEVTNEILFTIGSKILGESLLVEGKERREQTGKLVVEFSESVAGPLRKKIEELEASLLEVEELKGKVAILGNKVDGLQRTLSAIGWEIDASTEYAKQTHGDGPASTWELKNILIKDLVVNALNEQYPGNYISPYVKNSVALADLISCMDNLATQLINLMNPLKFVENGGMFDSANNSDLIAVNEYKKLKDKISS